MDADLSELRILVVKAMKNKNNDELNLIFTNLKNKLIEVGDLFLQDKLSQYVQAGKIGRNKLAEDYIPKKIVESSNTSSVIALKSDASGNCLYSSFSLCLFGNNTFVGELRLLTSIELYLNADFYNNHPMFTDVLHNHKEYFPLSNVLPFCVSFESLDSNEKGIFLVQREALENCKDKRWCPFLCILALSSTLNQAVSFHYPDNINEKFRKLFNRTIFPRSEVPNNAENINILFCYEGLVSSASNQPNHYVPLIFCDKILPKSNVLKRKIASNDVASLKQCKIPFVSLLNNSSYGTKSFVSSFEPVDKKIVDKKTVDKSNAATSLSYDLDPERLCPISSNQPSILQCSSNFLFPKFKYDIAYIVENYDSYAKIMKTLSNVQLLFLINNVIVPKKKYNFPKSRGRAFQPAWFNRFPWLCYSQKLDGAFCLYCVLFGCNFPGKNEKLKRIFTEPFSYWNDAVGFFEMHEFGKNNCKKTRLNNGLHMLTSDVYSSFMSEISGKSEPISVTLDKTEKSIISDNRTFLTPIIDTIIFCGRKGIPLRGHLDDSKYHVKPGEYSNAGAGNFVELLNLRVRAGDKVLESHLNKCNKNASYISKTSQNKLIKCCGQFITDKIVGDVTKARFFSILADEASDINNKEQLSLVIRFVDESNKIREEFLKFVECSEGLSGEGLCKVLLETLAALSIDIMDCRGQGYDGASAVSSAVKGLSGRILSLNEKALYTHCHSHRLNLAVSSSCSVQCVRNVMLQIMEISYFFNFSPVRQQIFERYVEEFHTNHQSSSSKKKLHNPCRTRWVQ